MKGALGLHYFGHSTGSLGWGTGQMCGPLSLWEVPIQAAEYSLEGRDQVRVVPRRSPLLGVELCAPQNLLLSPTLLPVT